MSDASESEHNTTFTSSGREAHGYLALPPTGTGPGLVVIQEWWGLTTHVADLVRRFAAEGFVALAPDLYGGRVAHDGAQAAEMMQAMPVEEASAVLAGAVDHLLGHEAVTGDAVGAVGFCMGGGFVLSLAAQQGDRVAAAAPFYGLPPAGSVDFAGLTAAVQGHYATHDANVTPAAVDATWADIAGASDAVLERFDYDAQHAFVNDEHPERHDPEATALAWSRVVPFLHRHLG